MSTRSTYFIASTVEDQAGVWIYRHSDGYPDGQNGAIARLAPVLEEVAEEIRTAENPARTVANALMAHDGNMREIDARPGDDEWFYRVDLYPQIGQIDLQVFKVNWAPKPDIFDTARQTYTPRPEFKQVYPKSARVINADMDFCIDSLAEAKQSGAINLQLHNRLSRTFWAAADIARRRVSAAAELFIAKHLSQADMDPEFSDPESDWDGYWYSGADSLDQIAGYVEKDSGNPEKVKALGRANKYAKELLNACNAGADLRHLANVGGAIDEVLMSLETANPSEQREHLARESQLAEWAGFRAPELA